MYEIHICTVVVDIIYFTSFHCTGRYEPNKLTSLPMCGFTAQLVEHCTSIAEVTGLIPVEALIFFRLLPSNCLNWKIYCDDHSSLSSLICKQFISELETSETVCQDSNLLFDTSLVDIPYTIFDTSTCAVSVTKSCAVSFYAFCFSVLIKLVCFWNSDTLNAIVESAMLNFTIEYWISSSELPQNINIHGANTAVRFVFLSKRGTLVCNWPSS